MRVRAGVITIIFAIFTFAIIQQTTPVQTDVAISLPLQDVVRFGTFNIQYGRGIDGHVDLSRIAEIITSHDLDVVFLNEVDKRWQRSNWQDQTKVLAQLTHMPYSSFAPALRFVFGASSYGNAILSRWPWLNHDTVPLPRHGVKEPRNMIVVRYPISSSDTPLTLIGTHLSTHTEERRAQLTFIRNHISVHDGPIILFGDLNAGPDNEDIQHLIQTGWIDMWNKLGEGNGFTFPSDDPAHRIDYVLASPQAARGIRHIEIVPTNASDHFPVIIEFDVNAMMPVH